MFPLPLDIYFELGAFLTSVICWSSLRKTSLRWFAPYLFFIVVVELTGRFLYYQLQEPNVWLYNLSIPIEYIFFAYIFFTHYKKIGNRFLARWFIIFFSLYTIGRLIFITGLTKFNSDSLFIGSFFMTSFAIIYFLELYFDLNSQESLWKNPMFWISIGVLLFNAGEFTYDLFSKYLIGENWDKTSKIFVSINNRLILVLYTCLAIAFVWNRTIVKYRKA